MSRSYEKVELTPAQLAAFLDKGELELALAASTVKLMYPTEHEIAMDEEAAEAVVRCGYALARGVEEAHIELEEEDRS